MSSQLNGYNKSLLRTSSGFDSLWPLTFSDVIGQEHITRTLQNEVVSGKTGHAFLFCGGRGTGKTSTARILSRALNCLSPNNGDPCNECSACKGILSGEIMDIIEIDAASNNGVDNLLIMPYDEGFLSVLIRYTGNRKLDKDFLESLKTNE